MSKKIETIKKYFDDSLDDEETINIIDSLEKNLTNENILINNTDTQISNESSQLLRTEFETERNKVSDIIIDLNIKFKSNIKEIPLLQSELYTYRQMMVEKRAKLQNSVSKINYKIKENKKKAYLKFKTNYDISFKSVQDLNIFIDDYLKIWMEKYEILSMQISFLEETINTIDRMIFGIKSRLTVEQILAGLTNY